MNKNQILYKSEKGYAIRQGMTYYAILKNNAYYSIKELIAGEEEPNTLKERWLKSEPAQRIIEQLNSEIKAEQEKKKIEEAKIKEEAEKLRLANSQTIQINNINSKEDFNQWLLNNNFKLEITDSCNIRIYKGAARELVIYLIAGIKETPYCCGGREHGNHSSHFIHRDFGEISTENYNTLLKYMAEEYDKIAEECALIKGYFTTSYIQYPDGVGGSALWGILFSYSRLFTKVGHFINKNTDHELDVYITSSEFTGYEI